MSKVITFSRNAPSYHPKAGQRTFFVEKIYNSFNVKALGEVFFADFHDDVLILNKHLPYNIVSDFINSLKNRCNLSNPKYHTIRAGSRFKVGDKFSPRVWGNDVNPKSGKSGPYHSKQIIIAPDIEVKKVWEIRIWRESLLNWRIYINGKIISAPIISELAKNDGLTHRDLLDWFNVPVEKNFKGQIICWNENINY